MKTLISRIKRFLLRLVTRKPSRKLTWTVEDFQAGKAWAKTQPHPKDPKLTYWDYLNQPWLDSTEQLAAVNQLVHMKSTEDETYTFI
jgi:hypothetical protein